jgi:hypothetical protein
MRERQDGRRFSALRATHGKGRGAGVPARQSVRTGKMPVPPKIFQEAGG